MPTVPGPDERDAVLARDDGRGPGANARIVRKLQPGDYWLSVRHERADATRLYSVGIKRRT